MTTALRKRIEAEYIDSVVVATSQSVGQGIPLVVDADGLATPSTAATTKATHVSWATEDGTWPATAGDRVAAVKLGSPCTIPIKVGTGGATKGEYGKATSDGTIDATVGGGTTLLVPICEFEETGAVGAFVGGFLGVSRTVGS
jgi:hypothetical protein